MCTGTKEPEADSAYTNDSTYQIRRKALTATGQCHDGAPRGLHFTSSPIRRRRSSRAETKKKLRIVLSPRRLPEVLAVDRERQIDLEHASASPFLGSRWVYLTIDSILAKPKWRPLSVISLGSILNIYQLQNPTGFCNTGLKSVCARSSSAHESFAAHTPGTPANRANGSGRRIRADPGKPSHHREQRQRAALWASRSNPLQAPFTPSAAVIGALPPIAVGPSLDPENSGDALLWAVWARRIRRPFE
ncbi:hypothetical protein C8Q77DRAFT_148941 [Trametes polyzona]|nr:hypothetical protein C8Q77DRAFT_148941 [Trametes polyzona]